MYGASSLGAWPMMTFGNPAPPPPTFTSVSRSAATAGGRGGSSTPATATTPSRMGGGGPGAETRVAFECILCLESLDRPAGTLIDMEAVGGRNQELNESSPGGGTGRNGGGGGKNGRGGGGQGWRGRGGGGTEWRNGSDGGWNGNRNNGGGGGGNWGNRTVWGRYNSSYNNGGRRGRSKDGGSSTTRIYGGSGGESIGRWGRGGPDNSSGSAVGAQGQRSGTTTSTTTGSNAVTATPNPKALVTTHCGHMFHQVCLEKWFRELGRRSCPSCRKMVSTSDVIRLHPSLSSSSVNNPGSGSGGAAIISPPQVKPIPQAHHHDPDPGPPIVGNSSSATWGSPFTSAGALNLDPTHFGGCLLGAGGHDPGCGYSRVLGYSLLQPGRNELWQRPNYLWNWDRGDDVGGSGAWRREDSTMAM